MRLERDWSLSANALAQGVEDVGTWGLFFAAEGVAKHVETNASEILKACTELIGRPASTGDHYLRLSVNSGLAVATDEVLGPFQPRPPSLYRSRSALPESGISSGILFGHG